MTMFNAHKYYIIAVAIAVEASSNLLTFTDAVTANAVDFVFVVVASDGALSLSLSPLIPRRGKRL